MIRSVLVVLAAFAATTISAAPVAAKELQKPQAVSQANRARISAALAESVERGGLVIDEKNLSPEFFDLKTGLAGQVLQKFTNYRSKLAIVVKNPADYGARFSELAYEHRTHPTVRFFGGEQAARQWLAQLPSGKC